SAWVMVSMRLRISRRAVPYRRVVRNGPDAGRRAAGRGERHECSPRPASWRGKDRSPWGTSERLRRRGLLLGPGVRRLAALAAADELQEGVELPLDHRGQQVQTDDVEHGEQEQGGVGEADQRVERQQGSG